LIIPPAGGADIATPTIRTSVGPWTLHKVSETFFLAVNCPRDGGWTDKPRASRWISTDEHAIVA
jgi:hypothetical protein